MAKKYNKKRNNKGYEKAESKSELRTGVVGMFASSEQILKDSASLAFSNVLGDPIDLTQLQTAGNVTNAPAFSTADAGKSVPGICALSWLPIVGNTRQETHPLNIAALNVYSYVRHANSGSANYDAPDLMMYILAVGSYFSFIAEMIRVYGVINYYNQKNRYLPSKIIEAMGYNFSDLVMHIADLRYFINHKISEASVLWIPRNMPFVKRWFDLNSFIYKDGESDKSQLYLTTPKGWLNFENRTSTSGSKLSYSSKTGNMSFDDIVTLGNSLSMPLISDEDIGIMAGDILKAYGADNIYGISQISEDYMIAPIYDEDMLMAIHNATIFSNGSITVQVSAITQDLTDDPGLLVQDIKIGNDDGLAFSFCLPKVLDILHDDISPEKVMLATRFMIPCAISGDLTSATTAAIPVFTGTEMIFDAKYYVNGDSEPAYHYNVCNCSASSVTNTELVARTIATQFHYGPLAYSAVITKSNGSIVSFKLTGINGELENYTIVAPEPLEKMHRTAVYAEFGVPTI